MKIQLISNWQSPQILDMVTPEAYRKIHAHLANEISHISRKPATHAEITCCFEPFVSYMAFDMFFAKEVYRLHAYAPGPWIRNGFDLAQTLPEDEEVLTLMNQRFSEFQTALGKNVSQDLLKLCARTHYGEGCWCAGGVKDTWRMAGFHSDVLLCYSFGTNAPDAECTEAWNRSEARKKLHFNIGQIVATEVIVVDKPIRKKRVKKDLTPSV